MSRFGIIGGAYQSQAFSADVQSCVNLCVEKDESGAGKGELILLNTPGTRLLYQLPDTPLRGIWNVQTPGVAERVFAVAGSTLCELLPTAAGQIGTVANGKVQVRGAVANDGSPASFASSATQLVIAAGGLGYCYTLATNILSAAIGTIAGVTQVVYADAFFVALKGNSAEAFCSAVGDGSSWDPTAFTVINVFADNAVSMVAMQRQICFLGKKKSVCYYNSGVGSFPFIPVPGSTGEQGSAAVYGVTVADNTAFGIWSDDKGWGVAFRLNGYTFQRISTHAIETLWQNYSTLSDCIVYPLQLAGHTFIHYYFPTANKSWRYDVATGLWAEVRFGQNQAHRSMCHAFGFNKHMLGDRASGNIYETNFPVSDGAGGWNFADDFGNAIIRERISPYIGTAGVRNYFNSLEIMADTGLGPNIPLQNPDGSARGPQLMVSWSDDLGHNWSNERTLDMGKIGEFNKRMMLNKLGSVWGSISRVFKLTFSDAAPLRITDADLHADPQMRPQKRLAAELRERA